MSEFHLNKILESQIILRYEAEILQKKLGLLANDLDRKGQHLFADQFRTFGTCVARYECLNLSTVHNEFLSYLVEARISALENINLIFTLSNQGLITNQQKIQVLEMTEKFCQHCMSVQQYFKKNTSFDRDQRPDENVIK